MGNKNRQAQIEKAADEYSTISDDGWGGFVHGAEWADKNPAPPTSEVKSIRGSKSIRMEFETFWLKEYVITIDGASDFVKENARSYEIVIPVDIPFDKLQKLIGRKTKVTIKTIIP